MSIVILGDLFQFPEGSAATNRVYTFAKGFQKQNVNVHVVCFGNEYVEEKQGQFENIHYYYPYAQRQRHPNFLARQWKKMRKYANTISILKKVHRNDPIEAIISYSNFLSTHAFAFLLAKRFGATMITECNEYPMRYYRNSRLKKVQGILKCRVEASLADGITCISPFLVDFFKQQGVRESKLFLLPSTVVASRFQKKGSKPVSFPYIGYFGGLSFERDNTDALITAFAKVSPSHPDMHLVIGGIGNEQDKADILRLAKELKIEDRVQLLGFLPRAEITRFIAHADLLVMVRKMDVLSQASFPSKLSEFLATANPVVAVRVGEVSSYLTDNVNAFLVAPEDSEALAAKLDFVLNNYEHAQQVGQRGYELTTSVFSYDYQMKRLMDFIDVLKN